MRRRLFALVVAVAVLVPRIVSAQEPLQPASLPQRAGTFSWDQDAFRGSFRFREIGDDAVVQKALGSGLKNVIALRAYLFKDGESEPVTLSARTCTVYRDLLEDVYRFEIAELRGSRTGAVLTFDGVLRNCAEVRNMILASKSQLVQGGRYFLGVVVEVNPVSQAVLDQMKRWILKPSGSTTIGPSDALFGSFIGLFVRNVAKADKTVTFRTQATVAIP